MEGLYPAVIQLAAFGFLTGLPLLAAVTTYWLLRKLELIWIGLLLVGTNVVSLPVAFVLVMLVVAGWPPAGTPGVGVATLPLIGVWAPCVVGSVLLLIGLAIKRTSRHPA